MACERTTQQSRLGGSLIAPPGGRAPSGRRRPLASSDRCLIVDDSPRFLKAARGLLEVDGVSVVAVATNGADSVRRAAELGPDVTLVDVELGAESGFDVARRLTNEADVA